MKSCSSSLVPLAILGAIAAIALGPGFIAAGVFGVSEMGAAAIGATSLGLTLYGLYRWCIYHQDKEKEVVSVLTDPVFGEVRLLRDRWEATLPIASGGEDLEILGDSQSPTPAQRATFERVSERLPVLLASCVEGVNNLLAGIEGKNVKAGPSIKADDLILGGISLDEQNAGSFTLTFEVASYEKVLPWGVSADFENFAVVEVSDNH